MNVEDMLAIRQEIARYSYTFDSGDAEGWANVFTADGVWENYSMDSAEPTLRLEGHDQLRAFCERQFSRRPAGTSSYHHQSGIIFDELTAETARTRVMVIITAQKPPEPGRVFLTGVYEDIWRKTPQGWKFEYRKLHP